MMLTGKKIWPALAVLAIAVLIGIFFVVIAKKSISYPSSTINIDNNSNGSANQTKNSYADDDSNESAVFQPNTQTYTNSKLGISFSYSSSWQRPLVVQSKQTIEIKLGDDLSIYIGENITKDNAKDKDKITKLIKREDTAVLIEYKNDVPTENVVEQIMDTIIITEPEILPTDKPISVIPTTNPYLSPTARPTPDPNQKGECTYGCVSENRFNK